MVKMLTYYCDCLNICVQCGEDSDRLDDYNLSEEEKQNDFFQMLPLIIVQNCLISEQHTALIQLHVIGSWIVHKCSNCAVYTHAMKSDESTSITFVNGALKKLTDDEREQEMRSSQYSPIFRILIPDPLYHPMDYDGTSHLPREISNSIIELKELLAEKIEERRELTNKIIEQFTLEQETALKNFIKRANNDFQSIKTAVLSNCSREEKESVISDFHLLESPAKAEQEDESKDPLALSEFETSLDYEGVFLFDENDKNDAIDEDSSEEDPPDTDDSGSRDEGIHIPRVKTVAVARSLPIRVCPNFDPSLRIFDERFDDDDNDDNNDARKPNDKRNTRKERRPVDIAASMKALAQSVYSDAIFGDLPPPRIGSRI